MLECIYSRWSETVQAWEYVFSQITTTNAPTTFLFELMEQNWYKINQKIKSGWFFCYLKTIWNHQNESMVLEMKIIKQRLEFEECLKQRLKFICELSKVIPTFINSGIRLVILLYLSVQFLILFLFLNQIHFQQYIYRNYLLVFITVVAFSIFTIHYKQFFDLIFVLIFSLNNWNK